MVSITPTSRRLLWRKRFQCLSLKSPLSLFSGSFLGWETGCFAPPFRWGSLAGLVVSSFGGLCLPPSQGRTGSGERPGDGGPGLGNVEKHPVGGCHAGGQASRDLANRDRRSAPTHVGRARGPRVAAPPGPAPAPLPGPEGPADTRPAPRGTEAAAPGPPGRLAAPRGDPRGVAGGRGCQVTLNSCLCGSWSSSGKQEKTCPHLTDVSWFAVGLLFPQHFGRPGRRLKGLGARSPCPSPTYFLPAHGGGAFLFFFLTGSALATWQGWVA